MVRKKLEELNLLNDFLFTTMLTYPGTGERFIRIILRVILGKEPGNLTITPQKVYPGIDTDKHGSRLDVFVEEEPSGKENAAVYDMEPDQNNRKKDIEELPRRTRFYHALIDVRNLDSGVHYGDLKNVTLIVVTSYDPFGFDRGLEEGRRRPRGRKSKYRTRKKTCGDCRKRNGKNPKYKICCRFLRG